jgi:hypothetical protein
VFKARSGRRQPHAERDLRVVWFIYAELAKDPDNMEAAVAAAQDRFGGSRAYVFRVWKKYGKVLSARAAAEALEQLDDKAGYD